MAKAAWIAQQTDARFVRELFPVRKRDTHKGDYGKVLLLCGSEGLTGAARFAGRLWASSKTTTLFAILWSFRQTVGRSENRASKSGQRW